MAATKKSKKSKPSAKKGAKKGAKKSAAKSSKRGASKTARRGRNKPLAKIKAAARVLAKSERKAGRTKRPHAVHAKDIGRRLSKAERNIDSLAKGQHQIAGMIGVHHQILENHEERIQQTQKGLRALLPPASRRELGG